MKSRRQRSKAEIDTLKVEAWRLKDAGISNYEIARRVGVSEPLTRLWWKQPRPVGSVAPQTPAAFGHIVEGPRPAPTSTAAQPKPVAAQLAEVKIEAGSDADSALRRTKKIFDKVFALSERAEQDGNTTAAQKALRDAGAAAVVIARLEKAQAKDSDAITMSRPEIAAAIASVQERVKILAGVPLTCARCGCDLRLQAVKGE